MAVKHIHTYAHTNMNEDQSSYNELITNITNVHSFSISINQAS
uniref:Uncharacterized protein n=1 Tax=Lepeophtheirus salmonis TaxID=72036 RepID=A0A0K2UW77_LEPSM